MTLSKGGVSIPPSVREKGKARAKALGLGSFSAYVTALIEADCSAPDAPFVVYPRKLAKKSERIKPT